MTAAAAMGALAELRAEGAACRALWCAVLARVLLDADRTDAAGIAARAWLLRPDPLVVELAGLDYEPARVALARMAARVGAA